MGGKPADSQWGGGVMEKRDSVMAGYFRGPSNDCPPAAATAEGQSNAVGATANTSYPEALPTDKAHRIFRSLKGGSFRTPKKGARGAASRSNRPMVTFRASTGQLWGFEGKKGEVLRMLATMPQGVTQWDTLPWHTRLGASVHALREAGLSIHTEREGDYRHARYFLRTPGYLTGSIGGAA